MGFPVLTVSMQKVSKLHFDPNYDVFLIKYKEPSRSIAIVPYFSSLCVKSETHAMF